MSCRIARKTTLAFDPTNSRASGTPSARGFATLIGTMALAMSKHESDEAYRCHGTPDTGAGTLAQYALRSYRGAARMCAFE